MKKFYLNEKEFEVLEGVYEPAEDSFLLAEAVKAEAGWKCLDLGTGSGIQAVNMAEQGAEVVASDVNENALDNAELNMKKIGLEKKIETRKSNLFEKIPEKFDCIVFNPPYVPGNREEWKDTDGGERGRQVLDRFIEETGKHLKEKGVCYFLQSSLNKFEETKEMLMKKKMWFEEVARRKLFFEELIVFKCWNK